MNWLVLDVETTTSNKGNPFDQTNKLCYVGLLNHTTAMHSIEYDDQPYVDKLMLTQDAINDANVLVGFNIKFDLHWLRRYHIDFSTKRIWDCQVVHFILTGQTHVMPSLNDVCKHYGFETKLDEVYETYWKNGIDTPDIPRDTLEEYLKKDLELTLMVYMKQLEELENRPLLKRLVSLHNQDLLVLEDMEYNGLLYDQDKSEELANELDAQITHHDTFLFQFHNCDDFNPNSGDHLSCLLYGGNLKLSRKVAIGHYKSGVKKGQVKEQWEHYLQPLPQLFKPMKGSELAKEGYYSTDEYTLKSLKGNKQVKVVLDTLLQRAELEKRVSTYYRGLLKLATTLNWKEREIHGQLNQTVARTGRLSSSKPNLQNFDGGIKGLFYSRFQ
jgi:DNA polymerase I-like protein with 3'-5' exonuclease and polymerase domains